MPFPITAWTAGRIRDLRRYAEEGHSCSEIAAKLGNTTRNAVIGKMHRLNIPSLNKPLHLRTKRSPSPRIKKPRLFSSQWAVATSEVKRPRVIDIDNLDVMPKHISLLQLDSKTCHWPYGDGPFTFCGCEVLDGPYCYPHALQSVGKGTISERLAVYAPKEAA